MNKQCAQLMMEELPRLVCYMRQNFCGSELSGLTLQQHRVMSCLLVETRSTTSLAEELAVSLPAVSRMIHSLMKSGWVTKESNKEDKRLIVLSLTKEGKAIIKASRQKSYSKLIPRLDELSNKQKQILIDACHILNKFSETKEIQ